MKHSSRTSQRITNLPTSDREKCDARIVYGVGRLGVRGTTFYDTWSNGNGTKIPIVEVCALHEESLVQVAGTTVHEIGHVLAGIGTGHGKDWKVACNRLGLRRAKAAGMRYTLAAFEPKLREYVAKHAFKDGKPVFFGTTGGSVAPRAPGPCKMGVGTKGGTSRGKGSGSRMRKYVCHGCEQIIRAATDDLDVQCNSCGQDFAQA